MFDLHFRLLLKRFGLLLAVYMLLRLFFLAFNFSTFSVANVSGLLLALLHGIRFDLSALCIINAPFILLSIMPDAVVKKKKYQFVLKWAFLVLNIPFIIVNIVDIEFFKFIGRRTSDELFTITTDIKEQAAQLILNYWYLVLLVAALVALLAWLYPRYPRIEHTNKKLRWHVRYIRLALVAGLTVLAIRGGLQFKPLRVNHAFMQEPAALGHLTLNSSFTFIKSIGSVNLERKYYFGTEEELLQALRFKPDKFLKPDGPQLQDNIVIIILESFGSEYIGAENDFPGYTPFFDSLAAQGTLFRHNYANGRKSIEAVPSILAGLPSFMPGSYINSIYQPNQLFGLGSILKEHGYATSFFHGASNGTMGFNTFAGQIGFDKYYGLNEYPQPIRNRDFDGRWGIFDEPFLQFFATELSRQKQPFLSSVFTLSSHQPYTIPAKYKGRFPKGELEIHESIGYADHALREFFNTAKQQPWYKNTLFILTADHTQMSAHPEYQNRLGVYKVPLLLFHPSKSFHDARVEQVTQQADIVPTVIDYLNIPTDKLLPFGRSVLDTTTTGRALFLADNFYTLVQHDVYAEMDEGGAVNLFSYSPHGHESKPVQQPEAKQKLEEQLKAFVQYFNNGLADNNLYFWRKKKQ